MIAGDLAVDATGPGDVWAQLFASHPESLLDCWAVPLWGFAVTVCPAPDLALFDAQRVAKRLLAARSFDCLE